MEGGLNDSCTTKTEFDLFCVENSIVLGESYDDFMEVLFAVVYWIP